VEPPLNLFSHALVSKKLQVVITLNRLVSKNNQEKHSSLFVWSVSDSNGQRFEHFPLLLTSRANKLEC
jgi:hypothetical protein